MTIQLSWGKFGNLAKHGGTCHFRIRSCIFGYLTFAFSPEWLHNTIFSDVTSSVDLTIALQGIAE